MFDFTSPSVCPWLRERNYHLIRKIVIEEGITSISSYAFYGCDEAEQIIIPDSVTSIGREAFSGCSMIKELTIPDSVKNNR
ncbi:leucine-rich repeat domain-containing protein [Ruminococcus sp. HUN007]|uniref:leucine-rich repeat domain-containing protein n=1 Tax=Ruminococcus sp. HUN007 TaxID=1514668 RepID=UPI0005D2D124|nr:leucine-rich repeat domain-containing protein [Ruminococcus sp. HUN007]